VIQPVASNHPYETVFSNTLGNALTRLYEQTGSIEVLDRAIGYMDDPDSTSTPVRNPKYHNSLASALLRRFEKTHLSKDIKKAVILARAAVNAVDRHSADNSIYLNTLSTALRARRQENDAKDAVKSSKEAVSHTPESHPNYGIFNFNLGRAFQCLSELEEEEMNLEQALTAYEKSVHSESTAPAIRIMSAIEAVNLFSAVDPPRAYRILRESVEQLAKASRRTLKRIDQQYTLSKFSGLASAAAAIALQANEPVHEAIRLLELGRGVLISYQLDARTEIDVLEEQVPDLADTFKRLRDEINSAPDVNSQIAPDNESSGLAIAKAIHRNALSEEFDQVVGRIREIKGFETFLQGPSLEELEKLASSGPIVLLNVALTRCDALIIHKGQPTALPLPTTMEEVETNTKTLKSLLHNLNDETYLEAGEQLRKILVWLWKCIVGPVLNSLGYKGSRKPITALPRIWWIPCSYLSFFPIHAAGDHKKGSIKNTLDCVVSSYTPTLRILQHQRERNSKYSSENSKAIFISMSETPGGKSSFPKLDQEINIVKSVLPLKVLSQPTKKDALSSIKSSHICFLGCHGETNEADPSQSRLLLHDWQNDPLTVADIVNLKLDRGRFAFLSACHSADNPNLDLLDESIHLTAAFQLAGFSHVVGSLWEVRDRYSAMITEGVVGSMTGSDGEIGFDMVAAGLQDKMKVLRDATRTVPGIQCESPPDPLIWAPYIFMGI
jgi:tetratricopeptide (TPR) repeat protein